MPIQRPGVGNQTCQRQFLSGKWPIQLEGGDAKITVLEKNSDLNVFKREFIMKEKQTNCEQVLKFVLFLLAYDLKPSFELYFAQVLT